MRCDKIKRVVISLRYNLCGFTMAVTRYNFMETILQYSSHFIGFYKHRSISYVSWTQTPFYIMTSWPMQFHLHLFSILLGFYYYKRDVNYHILGLLAKHALYKKKRENRLVAFGVHREQQSWVTREL